MFPNQQPPTSTTAAAGTSQTVTTTTTAQSATSATSTPAIVGAANTANMPETTAAQVLQPRAVQQGAQRAARRGAPVRIRPYQQRRAPATQTTANLPQVPVTAAAQGYQSTSGGGGSPLSEMGAALAPEMQQYLAQQASEGNQVPSIYSICPNWSAYSESSVRFFFGQLSENPTAAGTGIGLVWDGVLVSRNGSVQKGAVSSSALSFSENAITQCNDPALKELLLRANNEQDPENRKFLLVKALRAFNEGARLWHSALNIFCFLLDASFYSVASWQISLPGMNTVVERGGSSDDPLSIPIPVDVLTWPEMVRFLRDHIPLEVTADQADTAEQSSPSQRTADQAEAASTAPTVPLPSMQGIVFDEESPHFQERELNRMVKEFNKTTTATVRNTLFTKIVCVLKDCMTLPPDTYSVVCKLLGVSRQNISNWHSRYKRRIERNQQGNSSGLVPLSTPVAPTSNLLNAVPNLLLALQTPSNSQAAVAAPSPALSFAPTFVAASQAPTSFSMATTVTSSGSGQSTVQAPASPVFTVPAVPSTSAAVQLAPVLPPFTTNVPPQNLGVVAVDEDEEMQMAPISPVAQGLPPSFPIATTSAAPSVVQASTSPVFATPTAPAIPSTSAATQLTPILQPITLEDLLESELPQPPQPPQPPQLSAAQLRLNMAMSDEEMLSLFDD